MGRFDFNDNSQEIEKANNLKKQFDELVNKMFLEGYSEDIFDGISSVKKKLDGIEPSIVEGLNINYGFFDVVEKKHLEMIEKNRKEMEKVEGLKNLYIHILEDYILNDKVNIEDLKILNSDFKKLDKEKTKLLDIQPTILEKVSNILKGKYATKSDEDDVFVYDENSEWDLLRDKIADYCCNKIAKALTKSKELQNSLNEKESVELDENWFGANVQLFFPNSDKFIEQLKSNGCFDYFFSYNDKGFLEIPANLFLTFKKETKLIEHHRIRDSEYRIQRYPLNDLQIKILKSLLEKSLIIGRCSYALHIDVFDNSHPNLYYREYFATNYLKEGTEFLKFKIRLNKQ